MNTITVELPDEEIKLFKLLLKKFNARIISQSSQSNIESPQLEKRINESRKEKKEGKLITIDSKKLWESI